MLSCLFDQPEQVADVFLLLARRRFILNSCDPVLVQRWCSGRRMLAPHVDLTLHCPWASLVWYDIMLIVRASHRISSQGCSPGNGTRGERHLSGLLKFTV